MNISTGIIAVFWIQICFIRMMSVSKSLPLIITSNLMHLTIYFHNFHGHLNI